MPPLADPQILAQFAAALDNWNVTGYITAKGIVLDWIADNLPGCDLRAIAKLMNDYLKAGERPDQVRECRPEYNDRDYHYDFHLLIAGRQRQVYIESVLVDDDPSDPTIHIVSMHDDDS
jgi:hypothetical protein